MTIKERIASAMPFHIGMLSVDSGPARIAEMSNGQGWDLAFVDLQHTAYTEPQLSQFLHDATCADVPIMLRVPHPEASWHISRVLDFGAAAVLVPMVETTENVRAAVDSFYYPPMGNRSCGLGKAYGYAPSQDARTYANWWNANGILALQIETVRAVRDIRKLILPGVDLILFGGVDLSFSLEATPNCPFASVAACMAHAVEQTQGFDVRIGVSNLPFGRF